jgi:hypothetical protein
MVPLGACAVFMMWIRLFYFLKIFKSTGAFLRMVTQVFVDIKVLGIAFFLAVIAFANCFYLLALNSMTIDKDDPTQVTPPFTGARLEFIHAIIYSFLTGVGAFDTSAYDTTFAGSFIWIVWFLDTIIIKIILLSVIVSIMNQTHDAL